MELPLPGRYKMPPGNQNTCSFLVNVNDNVAPIVICQSITLQLDGDGSASITASQIDNGSTDNCGIATLNFDVSSFDCSDVGPNMVTLTLTDNSGNTATCSATVTVEDNIIPTAICQAITIQLDANGDANITASQIDNGSTDNCGIASLNLDVSSFDCTNVGTNQVVMTVTDNIGNSSTCSTTVTVEDNIAPTITCASDGERYITLAGSYIVSGSEFDPTSGTDNCSSSLTVTHNAESLFGDQGLSDISLADWSIPVGIHSITFTATDGTNSSDCEVSIEVKELSIGGSITMDLNCAPLPVRLEIYEAGTPNPSPILVETNTTEVDVNGDFSFDLTGLAPGNYGIYIKVDTYLQQFFGDHFIEGTSEFNLSTLIPGDIAGDTFGDNIVDGVDLSLIIAAYNTQAGDAGYNERADLNCDAVVDGVDMSMLIYFHNQMGDSPQD